MPSLLSWRPPGPVAKLPISGSQEMLPWPLCKEQRMTQSYIEPKAVEQCGVEKSNCYFWNSNRSSKLAKEFGIEQFKLRALASFWNCRRPQQERDWNLQGNSRQFKNSFDSNGHPEKHPVERLESKLCFTLESGDPNGDQHHKFRRFSDWRCISLAT